MPCREEVVALSVRADCRHYVMQTTTTRERVERCRLGVNEPVPFACPEGCLFFEARTTSSAGWQVADPRPEDPPQR